MLKKLHGRKLAVCLIGGAMYALFSAFGWQAEHGGVIWAGGALLVAALLVWPIAALLAVLLERGYTRALRREKTFRAGRAFAFILACYVPMFCVAFPGSFAYDVPYQLRQVVTGAYSTHHPLLHTLALGGLLQLGRALGDINLGAALYTALQMVLLAGCFALTCGSIARQSGARAAKRAAVFFALYPLNMVMAVNATKDVLFCGFFALTLALLNEIQEKPSRGLALKIAACGALAVMLRNNMAYAALVWLALLTIGLRKAEKSAALAMLLALAVGLCGNAALKHATRAESGDMSEMLSWPIQQLARARLYDEERLTDAEKEAILDAADKGGCVIIGRCASSLLRDRKNVLSVFIYADEADRVARIASRNRLDEPQARARMRKTDRMRRRYFDFYADTQWGDPESYDVMLSSSYYGVDGCVEMICKSLQMKGNSHE